MEKKTAFRDLSPKAKLQYIWDYYKLPIFLGSVIAIVVISVAYTMITYRKPLLSVLMINCNDPFSSEAVGFDEFLDAYGYDARKQPVSLSSSLTFSEGEYSMSYNDYQVLTMMIAAGDQDLFFGTGDVYLSYAEQGALTDLSKVLPAGLLARYEEHLIYATDDGTVEPYPCAVELTGNEWLQKNNYYDSCYFGILAKTDAPEASAQFAEFLLNY